MLDCVAGCVCAQVHADLVQLAFDMHSENGKLGRLQMMFTLGQLGSLEKLDHRRCVSLLPGLASQFRV